MCFKKYISCFVHRKRAMWPIDKTRSPDSLRLQFHTSESSVVVELYPSKQDYREDSHLAGERRYISRRAGASASVCTFCLSPKRSSAVHIPAVVFVSRANTPLSS